MNYAEIGRRLKAAREAAGLTLDQVADEMACDTLSILSAEKDCSKYILNWLLMLCRVVNLDPSDLFRPDGSPTRAELEDKKNEWKRQCLSQEAVANELRGRLATAESDAERRIEGWKKSLVDERDHLREQIGSLTKQLERQDVQLETKNRRIRELEEKVQRYEYEKAFPPKITEEDMESVDANSVNQVINRILDSLDDCGFIEQSVTLKDAAEADADTSPLPFEPSDPDQLLDEAGMVRKPDAQRLQELDEAASHYSRKARELEAENARLKEADDAHVEYEHSLEVQVVDLVDANKTLSARLEGVGERVEGNREYALCDGCGNVIGWPKESANDWCCACRSATAPVVLFRKAIVSPASAEPAPVSQEAENETQDDWEYFAEREKRSDPIANLEQRLRTAQVAWQDWETACQEKDAEIARLRSQLDCLERLRDEVAMRRLDKVSLGYMTSVNVEDAFLEAKVFVDLRAKRKGTT